MASKARRAGSLATILNANTAAASNTLVIDSGGDISLSGSLTVSSGVVGYITNTDLQATFAQNTAITSLNADYLQVANADVLYVTKSTALTSNNALINLINDRYQVANASVKFVTKSIQLTSNNSLVNLINDRIQAANVSTTLGTYWPSANVIAYTDSVVTGSTKSVNSSIYIASGGENRVAIPYTNTNHMLVYLNGIQLVEGSDYEAANNAHIGNITPVLAEGDVLLVEEFKNHSSNTTNRSSGGGGGGFSLQGSVSGYGTGGYCTPFSSLNIIQKYPFVSEGAASDVGDLTVSRYRSNGFSSATDGYSVAGTDPSYSIMNKFPFATDTNATCIGNYCAAKHQYGPQNSSTHGYVSGGAIEGFGGGSTDYINEIDKWPFSSETTVTDVGDLTCTRSFVAGVSSSTHGYAVGGSVNPPPFDGVNIIDKFPFASDANATDVGDLTNPGGYWTGVSSSTKGYAVGPVNGAKINAWPFASDVNATCVGTSLTNPAVSSTSYGVGYNRTGGGTQSTTKGYMHGGDCLAPNFAGTRTDIIQAWPFASEGNATCVGNLTVCVALISGGIQT